MKWERKLQVLIDAHEKGHPLVKVGLSYIEGLNSSQILELSTVLNVTLPEGLKTLYSFSDGIILAINVNIFSLSSDKFRNILDFNKTFLEDFRSACRTHKIELVFGTDGLGAFLCLTEDKNVVSLESDWPEGAELLSSGIDEFFNSYCLGNNYVQYYKPQENDFWLLVLKEFGFII